MSNPKPSLAEQLHRAIWSYQSGHPDEAERLCKTILRKKPATPPALHLLAAMAIQRGHLDEALALIDRALRFKPDYVEALVDRSNLLQALGRHADAAANYEKALALRPNDVALLYGRGVALVALNRSDEALRVFDRIIALAPDHVQALNNRGGILHLQNRLDEALASYDQALKLQPTYVEALTNRGVALTAMKRHSEALTSLDKALAINPHDADALYYRGFVLGEINRCDEAAASYELALAARPGFAKARFALCMASLPTLYMEADEIARGRVLYARRLEALQADVARGDAREFAAGVGPKQPFYLAYQGQNDRELQARYGELVCRIMAERYPPATLAPAPQSEEPVRVGIVSGFFRNHSNWKIPIKGWLGQLDRTRFRLFGYSTDARADAQTETAARLCERFVRGPLSIERWRAELQADAPHVLIYPEVGMDNISVQLAAQRLAPVQCNSWGHPDTSGFPTLDYFLSSDLMEPADGQDHYTERLVRLPNLSFHYEPLDIFPLPTVRADLGLRAGAIAFWCGQSLFKYLPQFDEVFPRIAREVAGCQFAFIAHYSAPEITALFHQRLERAFAASGLVAADHCVFLPQLDQSRFAAAIGCCDVILDSIGWSGCNSTFESLPHHLPIVTMAGDLMRGRHTMAILKMMGVSETITENLDGYVAMAARLANDAQWRAQLSGRMAANAHMVYRDRGCIEALEAFLMRAAQQIEPR